MKTSTSDEIRQGCLQAFTFLHDRKASRRNQQNAFASSLTDKDHPQATSWKPIYLGDYKQNDIARLACEHLRASSPIWASKASLARTRERGGGGSTMMKGNLCIYKCFIDVLYIFDRFFKKNWEMRPT